MGQPMSGWPDAVGAHDKAVYVDDVVNKRILRLKLDCGVTETVSIP
jgi:hypothetical protein